MARKKTLPPGWQGTADMPATPSQIRAIHTLKGKLHMDDESYVHVIARNGDGVMSSKDLTRVQASKVIKELEVKLNGQPAPAAQAATGTGKRTKKQPKAKPVTTQDNVVALATPAQTFLIGHLTREVNWYEHGSYEDWLRNHMKMEKVVTKEQAGKVIEGLKGLKRHGHARAQ